MKVAVLIPCYNEEPTVRKTVEDFRRALPEAEVWVYDNNSTDRTAEEARAGGARVSCCPQQGKGNVIRQMFYEIDADCYLMVDGDDTYPAEEADKLIDAVVKGNADMATGDRLSSTYATENKRVFHTFGNNLVCLLIGLLFRRKVHDVMTGYRAFSRRFVKNFPVLTGGFELETEMTLFALDKRMNLREIPVRYRDRPAGSQSKLNTYVDGFLVLRTIFRLFKDYRPLWFFLLTGTVCIGVALGFFIPVLADFLRTGAVARFPTLFCSLFLAAAGLLCYVCGLILDSIKRYFDQEFELNLLNHHQGGPRVGEKSK